MRHSPRMHSPPMHWPQTDRSPLRWPQMCYPQTPARSTPAAQSAERVAGYFTAPRITPPTTHFWAKM